MTKEPEGELFRTPEGLDADETLLFCVGALMVSWSNCESILRAVYEAIVGGRSETASRHAINAWFSHVSSNQRNALLRKAIQGSELAEKRKSDGLALLKSFEKYTERRNELAHAHYRINPTTRSLEAIEVYKSSRENAEISAKTDFFSESTIRDLKLKINLIEQLNRKLWMYLILVKVDLGSTYPVLPVLPEGYLIA